MLTVSVRCFELHLKKLLGIIMFLINYNLVFKNYYNIFAVRFSMGKTHIKLFRDVRNRRNSRNTSKS